MSIAGTGTRGRGAAGQPPSQYPGRRGAEEKDARPVPSEATELVKEVARLALADPVGEAPHLARGLPNDFRGRARLATPLCHRTQLVGDAPQRLRRLLLAAAGLALELGFGLADQVATLLGRLLRDLLCLLAGGCGDLSAGIRRAAPDLDRLVTGDRGSRGVSRRAGTARTGCLLAHLMSS
jgi:hypothetical protein